MTMNLTIVWLHVFRGSRFGRRDGRIFALAENALQFTQRTGYVRLVRLEHHFLQVLQLSHEIMVSRVIEVIKLAKQAQALLEQELVLAGITFEHSPARELEIIFQAVTHIDDIGLDFAR